MPEQTLDEALSDVLRAPDDVELSRMVRDAMASLEGYEDQMARAWGKRRQQLAGSPTPSSTERMRKEIKVATDLLMNVADSLKYTDEALTKSFEERMAQRIWADAKQAYRHRNPEGLRWDQLTTEQRGQWYDYADESVPLTWEKLTPAQRKSYAGEVGYPDNPAELYARARAEKIRRRASFKIDFAGYPYRVHPDPTARMSEVATMAQTRGYILADTGRTELELAVWDEHYRRALHAYTHPFDPYYGETP